MNDNRFDELLKDRLEGFTEEVPDIWGDIQGALDTRRRWKVIRRTSIAVAAAAACLVGGMFIFKDSTPGQQPEAPVQIAVVTPVVEPAETHVQADAVPSIAQQVKSLMDKGVTAEAAIIDRPSTEEVETILVPQKDEETQESVTPQKDEAPSQPKQEEDTRLDASQLPANFWDEDYDTSHSKIHTSQISILSNLTTVASPDGLMSEVGPMHSASQSGKDGYYTSVQPLSTNPEDVKFYAPVALGIQLKTKLTDRLYAGVGLSYSYLVSQYDALIDKVRYEGAYNQLHYLGVPVTLYWHFVDQSSFDIYGSVGAAAEKCISQRYVYGSNVLYENVRGLQYSANIGLGVEYWFIPKLGIYFDPSLVYYLDNSQPLSIRTQQPLQARFELGFRFKL